MNRFDKLPVRWRLAITSAGLTFVILMLFAILVEVVTVSRMRSDFDNDLRASAQKLADQIRVNRGLDGSVDLSPISRNAIPAALAGGSVLRILDLRNRLVQNGAQPTSTPDLGKPSYNVRELDGYRVVSRDIEDFGHPVAVLEYGKPVASLDNTVGRVRLFLILGVLGGSALALLAGLAVARRAMSPIARLTSTARDIARTRDTGLHMPMPEADDEVADLARTLEQMLHALDSARGETQAMLERQREFVADASHELRTPLTSILTNLELLEADLEGEDREIAGAALRSSQRMRRLVADLLLLARADAGRQVPHEPVNLAYVVREAAAEVAPTALDHDLSVDADDSGLTVDGAPDELHRLAVNLIGNAVSHTPAGSRVEARVRRDGEAITLTVEDNGPGVPPELRDRIFDRFVRGEGDRGSGSGLGLAIVKAVADGHGGSVALESPPEGGARFVVTLPASQVTEPAAVPVER